MSEQFKYIDKNLDERPFLMTNQSGSTDDNNSAQNFQEMIDNWRMSMDALKPVCGECGRVCSNTGNLKQHMKNMHGPPDQWEICHVCQKQCKSRQYLLQHLLQTHGIRQRSRFMTDIYKI